MINVNYSCRVTSPATASAVEGATHRPLAIGLEPGEVVYCFQWDDLPGNPVFCRGKKLARAE